MARTLHTYSDGGARGNPGPSAIGVVICDEHDKVLDETAVCIGRGTNNQAEYKAMLLALELAKKHQGTKLLCSADSELIVYQLSGKFKIKDSHLKTLAEKVKSLAVGFEAIRYRQIPREHPLIARADALLNKALDSARDIPSSVIPESAAEPSAQGELF